MPFEIPISAPSFGVLLASFACALFIDFRSHRIPNWLVMATLLAGWLLLAIESGFAGLLSGISGALVGLAGLMPFYLLRAMGAGDVKYMAAIGAHLGPALVFQAVVTTIIAGGALGVLFVLFKGGIAELSSRYANIARISLVMRRPQYIPAPEGSAAAQRFPYSSAIVLGTLSVLLLDSFRFL